MTIHEARNVAFLVMAANPCPDEIRDAARCRYCGGKLTITRDGHRVFSADCPSCQIGSLWHCSEWLALTDRAICA